jgi:hypothetical protein
MRSTGSKAGKQARLMLSAGWWSPEEVVWVVCPREAISFALENCK